MKTNRAKIIHAGHIGNPKIRLEDNCQDKGSDTIKTNLDTGEDVVFLPSKTTFQTSPVNQKGIMYFNKKPEMCEYQKDICPNNIHKYSMKCIFNKNTCKIKKYFDKWRIDEINELGIGGLR